MKRRVVAWSPEAQSDLSNIHDHIADEGSPISALRYVERIMAYCENLDHASVRGTARDDIRSGLRIVGFERRITIAFTVEPEHVVILRLFYAGANWEELL